MFCDKPPSARSNYNGCGEVQGVILRSWKRAFCLTPPRTGLLPTPGEPSWRPGMGLEPPLSMHIYDQWYLAEKGGESSTTGHAAPARVEGGQSTFMLLSWLLFSLTLCCLIWEGAALPKDVKASPRSGETCSWVSAAVSDQSHRTAQQVSEPGS